MTEKPLPSLDELKGKINALQEHQQEENAPSSGPPSRDTSVAMRLGIEFVSCVGVAGFIGYYADQWLGTLPWLFILFLCFGMAAGVMTMMRTMKMVKPNDQERDNS